MGRYSLRLARLALRESKSGLTTVAVSLLLILLMTIAASAAGKGKVLYSFCALPGCSDGSYPEGGVIFDAARNLYGTTNVGGAGYGTVFTLTLDSGKWILKTIYTFTTAEDGFGPTNLVFDNQGNLYGTTGYGGGSLMCSNGGCGTVFQLVPVNGVWTKNTLYAFTGGADGSVPLTGVVLDNAGNLYGTTWEGGTNGAGTVFELVRSGNVWTEVVLHSFTGGIDGGTPLSGLVLDNRGHLYGTTSRGGSANFGTVFEVAPTQNGWRERVLHSFTGRVSDGAVPWAGSLILDRAGNLYGTTSGGGTSNFGTVFQLSRPQPGVVIETILCNFLGGNDGSAPYTGVIIDSAGNLYGTTSVGGIGLNGTVFTLTNVGGLWTKKVLYSFNATNGSEPFGNLVFDRVGHVYGAAASGGPHDTGVVFEIAP
jgi:uncharacterized repeat protein (TIGR03803 family)